MVAYYGGGESFSTEGIGDVPIIVQPYGEQAEPYWVHGQQVYTGAEDIEAAKAKLRLATLMQSGALSDPSYGAVPSVWETGAKKYTEWYEEQTPTERIAETLTDWGSGTGQEIEDILTGSIAATGGAIAGIIEPIAEPTGEFLESLILPAAAVAALYVLIK